MTTFHFDHNFQVGILALMTQSKDFLLTAASLVRPEYFEDRALIWVFQRICEHYENYTVTADRLVLLNEMKKSVLSGHIKKVDLVNYMAVLDGLNTIIDAKEYVTTEVVRFCRRQEVRREMLALAPLTDSQDDEVWNDIETRMSKACSVGAHAVDIGTQFFLHYPDRLHARMMGEEGLVMPTGIPDLDVLIGGGLKSGQLGIWLGGTASGKSIALPQCAKRAIIAGYKVVHYTLELNEQETATRYDASFSTIPVYDLQYQTMRVGDKLGFWNTKFGNSLIIKEYPTGMASVNTLRQHLISLRSVNFIPDLIVCDYGDLLKPLTNYNDEYADLGAIFRDLRGLAGELKIPLWTASQVNRAGIHQEVNDVDSIGDSFKKAQIADIIISICATREELEANTLRLYLAKNRNGPPKRQVKIRCAYERMCFYDPFGLPVIQSAPPGGSTPPPGLPPAKKMKVKT